MKFLSVRIDEVNLAEARQKALQFLLSGEQFKIFTPNPEILVKAQADEYFKKVLNSGSLNICDGFGTAFFIKIKKISGTDFMSEICRLCVKENKSVFLLGSGREDVVKKTAVNLQKQFPKLKIVGFDQGPKIIEKVKGGIDYVFDAENTLVIDKINAASPDVIFVAFGMGKQEKWIQENIAKLASVKIAMGVGGAFDFISGHIRRAPCWMRHLGLEWVYRLIKQPRRAWRIYNATIKFVWLVFKDKFYD